MSRLAVDAKYLTQPLNAEVLKLANAWKGPYLQRLSKEKVDPSYINSYLRAWNLKPEDVFADGRTTSQPTQ